MVHFSPLLGEQKVQLPQTCLSNPPCRSKFSQENMLEKRRGYRGDQSSQDLLLQRTGSFHLLRRKLGKRMTRISRKLFSPLWWDFPFSDRVKKLVNHPRFDNAIMGVICLQTILLSLEYHGEDVARILGKVRAIDLENRTAGFCERAATFAKEAARFFWGSRCGLGGGGYAVCEDVARICGSNYFGVVLNPSSVGDKVISEEVLWIRNIFERFH
jgi:hypothetical protein